MRRSISSALVVCCACGGGGSAAPGVADAGFGSSRESIVAFVQHRGYSGWSASGVRRSAGAHGGDIRVWFSDALLASSRSGAATHPVGSAAVKELLDGSGSVRGHAVMVKDARDGWVYLEAFAPDYPNPSFFAGRRNFCADCHAQGKDFIRSAPPE